MQIWNIPFSRNPFFTGREDLLERLHMQLHTTQTAALSQPQAISGLGGIGKTQVAIEYAYRYRQEYQHVLWARADTTEALNASYIEIAGLLHLPGHDAQEQEVIVQAVKHWLRTNRGWLLLLDNAEELDLMQPFLPTACPGHLLLTTRAQWMGELAQPLSIETMETEAGALLVLRRARLVAFDASLDAASPEERTQAIKLAEELGGLPLALDQAGAYLEETGCGLADYLQRYQTERAHLLARRGGKKPPHPEPVATTWAISFANVEKANSTAAELLHACAFLAPDAIPEELLREVLKTSLSTSDTKKQQRGWGAWFPWFMSRSCPPQTLASSLEIDEAVAILRIYSLIQRNTLEKTVLVHRLVQAIAQDTLEEQDRMAWMIRIVYAVDSLFPEVDVDTWERCAWYLPQTLICAKWIAQNNLKLLEGASLLSRAGIYLCNRGQYQEVKPLFERALAIRNQQLGVMHPDTAQSLYNLAGLYRKQGQYGEAEPLYQHALAICEQKLGVMHPDTAQNLNDLALLYENQGKYVQAELFFERAVAIYEQHFGPEHPDTATVLNNLANLYGNQGKYKQAELLSERSLAIRERYLGPGHPDTANSFTNLALICKSQGKYERAELLYKRALAIHEQQLGPEHPDTATVLNNLAALYDELSKHEQAEPLYKRALAIYERWLGASHPAIALGLNNLAMHYNDQGKDTKAEPLYNRALAVYEQELGAEHPDTASSLNNLAEFYRMEGKYAEAEPLMKRALVICEQALGSHHPTTQIIESNYTLLLEAMKQEKEIDT